jgi:hypothetical protein
MNRILVGLIALLVTLPVGFAQAASETANKPSAKQGQIRSNTGPDAPCPEDPPTKKELKKKSTMKKVEPAEAAKKPAP